VEEIRSYDTNINNFIPNWKPRADGRVHPSYGYTAPQGQINSWRPNSQNVSKHTEFGQEFRKAIAAPEGYCFVEADKKSFHVATLGYCANDKDYIRFSQIDPHSILGSYIDPTIIGDSISFKWSDADIKIAAAEFKKRCKEHKAKDQTHNIDVRQELAKPTVLGNQLELGAKKLQRQNRRFIKTMEEAERLQKIVANLFPKVEVYKKQIKEKAYLDKFLIDEFGRIQWFFDVFQFSWSDKSRQWQRKDGEGAREPISFRVQGTAFGFITEELLEMERKGLNDRYNFVVTIHDSLMYCPRVEDKNRCIADLQEIMNKPCKQLVNGATGQEGLIVGVEVSVGKNWKAFDKTTNPEGMKEI
jgi:DNA polymerase I-like protein with 3'-5' exonuclease and polymerase domains